MCNEYIIQEREYLHYCRNCPLTSFSSKLCFQKNHSSHFYNHRLIFPVINLSINVTIPNILICSLAYFTPNGVFKTHFKFQDSFKNYFVAWISNSFYSFLRSISLHRYTVIFILYYSPFDGEYLGYLQCYLGCFHCHLGYFHCHLGYCHLSLITNKKLLWKFLDESFDMSIHI